MKTLQELQLQWGESTCGRSIEQYVYDYFKGNGMSTELKNVYIKLGDAKFEIADLKLHQERYAADMVLKYARWFDRQGPDEYMEDDESIKQNVKSFYESRR